MKRTPMLQEMAIIIEIEIFIIGEIFERLTSTFVRGGKKNNRYANTESAIIKRIIKVIVGIETAIINRSVLLFT